MAASERIDVRADVCFACGRKLGKRAERMVVDTRDGQEVHVGADCFKHVQAAGDAGYQPPKGGPRLYPMTTKGALAVMKDCCASLGGDEAEQLHQARAAVAELIEKAAALATAVAEETEYFATHKHLDEASFFENRVVQCTDELRAALGRMGEGA